MSEPRQLRVHALFRLPELTELPGVAAISRGDTATIDEIHYDTDDLRLFRWASSHPSARRPRQGWR